MAPRHESISLRGTFGRVTIERDPDAPHQFRYVRVGNGVLGWLRGDVIAAGFRSLRAAEIAAARHIERFHRTGRWDLF